MRACSLRAWEGASRGGATQSSGGAAQGGGAAGAAGAAGAVGARPRVVVFTADEDSAVLVSQGLRSTLWGDHAVAVLLPTSGMEPSLVTDRFRRAAVSDQGFAAIAMAKSSSVLVAPISTARGLDFANVTLSSPNPNPSPNPSPKLP